MALDTVEDLVRRFVAEASRLGAEFADIRIEKARFTRLVLKDGVLREEAGSDYGAAIRVYYGGSFGFAYTSTLSWEAVRRALNSAFSMARSVKGNLPKPLELGSAEAFIEHPAKRSVEDVDVSEKVSDLSSLDKLLASSQYVKSRTVSYYEEVEEKYYGSTEDRFIGERRELVYLAVSAFASEAGKRGSTHATRGTIKGYTIWEKEPQEKLVEDVVRRLRDQLRAKEPRAGSYPVILSPETVGVFVHEAFGHLAEADLVVSGSVLQGRKGEIVASPLVTIVDDPGIDDGFGSIRYDDEGVATAKAVIVEKGVHKQIMTDRIHAALLGEKPTGNARAESFRYPPLVRMRNTVMLPGDASFEEMVEDIEFGYYIVSTAGGQTNLDGSFQVGVREAYEIVRGKIGDPVRNLSISGNTLETLRDIDMVGRDFKLFYGRCGKGQVVFVSDGGPHVRVRKMTIGGRA